MPDVNDAVRSFLLTSPDLTHEEAANAIREKFGISLTTEAIRKRRKRLKHVIAKRPGKLQELCKELGVEVSDVTQAWIRGNSGTVQLRSPSDGYENAKKEFLAEVRSHAPKYKPFKRSNPRDPHLLVVDPADMHFGKLAFPEETGESYSMEIASKRLMEGVHGILNRTRCYEFDLILLMGGNDVLHIDTPTNTTTKGTYQDVDGLWWKIAKDVKQLFVSVIDLLLTEAPVHYVHVPSNHDFVLGFMLADTLESWYHTTEDVTFDSTIQHRKYFQYHDNMICASHGDGCKPEDMPILMASEQPKMWAATNFRYAYLHHHHHMKKIRWVSGSDYHGATVEFSRSCSSADRWHYTNGFSGVKAAMDGFIHHPTDGQVSKVTHYF